MGHLFLLEDDVTLGKNLKLYLETHDYSISWARDLRSAKLLYSQKKIDLMILDWSLPDGTGLEFLQSLDKDSAPPAFFLTAQEDEASAVEALTEGAVDYLRKPFGQGELLVKIKKLLGEAHNRKQLLRFLNLTLDVNSKSAFLNNQLIKLRRREYSILELLLRKSDQIVTRENVLALIDESGEGVFDRTVDSHMSRLRKALKDSGAKDIEIESVYGSGYRLKKVA